MYIPLHWHSTYSFLEALWQPKQIVQRAKELWFPAIAITDYNGMYSVPSFFLSAQETKNPDDPEDNWMQAIFGFEIWFVMDLHASLIWKNIWNICLLAQTDEWYHRMMELVAYANQEWFTGWIPKLDLNILKEKSEGIIVFTGGEQSWISKMQISWESDDKIKEIYQMLQWIFWDRCYLQITAQNEKLFPVLRKCNQFIYKLANQTNTKLLVDNNYCYVNKTDKDAWEIALSIKDWTKMYDANRRRPAWDYYIMDGEEIRKICLDNWYAAEEIDERMDNNWKIGESVHTSMLLHQKLFPKYETPDNIKELYDKYADTSIIE